MVFVTGVTRVGWIAVSLVALVLPAGGVCGMMTESADSIEACAMSSGHDMADCADEIAVSKGCCDPGAGATATDLVLKRPDEDAVVIAGARLAGVVNLPEPDGSTRLLPEPAPPPRPSPYRLFSALLL